MKFISGVIKSEYDKRDYLMKSFLEYKALPSKFDITKQMTPVRSQGKEGSCVGFAMITGCKEYQEQIDVEKFVELSPRFLYEEAKLLSGHKEGTTLKAAMQIAKKFGVCEEKYWPYIPNDSGSPNPKAYENAEKYKIKTYARISNLTELKQAMVDFNIGPVLIGIRVFKGMLTDEARRDGIVPDPSCWDRMKGGHALCMVGYNDESLYYKKGGHIKFKNSWSDKWGEAGYGYLSYRYIKKNMIDAFSSVDIKGSRHIMTVEEMSIKESNESWI